MPSKPRVKTARTFEEFKKVLNSKFPHLSNLRKNSIANLGVQVKNGVREPKNTWANLKEISVDEFLSLFEVPINSLPAAPAGGAAAAPVREENPAAHSNQENNHGSPDPLFQEAMPVLENAAFKPIGGANSVPLEAPVIVPNVPTPTKQQISPHEAFLKKFGKTAKAVKRGPWRFRRTERRRNKKTKRTRRH
jgi:hypothetical protein